MKKRTNLRPGGFGAAHWHCRHKKQAVAQLNEAPQYRITPQIRSLVDRIGEGIGRGEGFRRCAGPAGSVYQPPTRARTLPPTGRARRKSSAFIVFMLEINPFAVPGDQT